MAADFDAPRRSEDPEPGEDSLEQLKTQQADAQNAVDLDETELAETLELPGADLSNEELTIRFIPKQANEFTCSSCYLVHHRSQLAPHGISQPICTDCA